MSEQQKKPILFRWKGKIVSEKVYNWKMRTRELVLQKRLAKSKEIPGMEVRKVTFDDHEEKYESRIVSVNFLSKQLWCNNCKECLSLENIQEESRRGLGSVLSIVCHKCAMVKNISTSRENVVNQTNLRFDINLRVVKTCLKNGIGYMQLADICEALNVPYISNDTYQKYVKEIQELESFSQNKSNDLENSIEKEISLGESKTKDNTETCENNKINEVPSTGNKFGTTKEITNLAIEMDTVTKDNNTETCKINSIETENKDNNMETLENNKATLIDKNVEISDANKEICKTNELDNSKMSSADKEVNQINKVSCENNESNEIANNLNSTNEMDETNISNINLNISKDTKLNQISDDTYASENVQISKREIKWKPNPIKTPERMVLRKETKISKALNDMLISDKIFTRKSNEAVCKMCSENISAQEKKYNTKRKQIVVTETNVKPKIKKIKNNAFTIKAATNTDNIYTTGTELYEIANNSLINPEVNSNLFQESEIISNPHMAWNDPIPDENYILGISPETNEPVEEVFIKEEKFKIEPKIEVPSAVNKDSEEIDNFNSNNIQFIDKDSGSISNVSINPSLIKIRNINELLKQ